MIPRARTAKRIPAAASWNPLTRSALTPAPNRRRRGGGGLLARATAPRQTSPRNAESGPRTPPIVPSEGPIRPPTEYAAKIRLMQRYSSPGQRSSVLNVKPIQRPPEPAPITARPSRSRFRSSAAMKTRQPAATTPSATASTTRIARASTSRRPPRTRSASRPGSSRRALRSSTGRHRSTARSQAAAARSRYSPPRRPWRAG
jgi:hypothetical protein